MTWAILISSYNWRLSAGINVAKVKERVLEDSGVLEYDSVC